MSRRAWGFVLGVILVAVLSAIWAVASSTPTSSDWLTFCVIGFLATIAQFLEAEAPGRQSYYPHLVFFFAGLVLLPPALFVLVVAVPHGVEWVQKRLTHSPLLRDWYIQPFNIATHLIAGICGRVVWRMIEPALVPAPALFAVLAALSGALVYAWVDHLIIGLVLFLARGISLRESGILGFENVSTDLMMLLMGYVVAVLWGLNPWLLLPALAPLLLIYRALKVPQLKREAQTDEKTGLWNARHWRELCIAELNRANRFERPLSLIMADLDLLRNINNTYGHLAGDAVLAGVGRIISDTVREYDIAGRFGGEEFAIVLPETNLTDARDVAERLRKAVEAAAFEVRTSPTPIRVTLSLGVACRRADTPTPDELIHEADVALYQAKLGGRNRVIAAADISQSGGPGALPEDRGVSSEVPTPPDADRPEPPPRTNALGRDAPAAPTETPPETPGSRLRAFLPLFVGGVIAAGLALTIWGLWREPIPDWLAIGLFAVCAVLAELFPVDVYQYNTVSVSAGVNFAAALVIGLPGVACVSASIVLIHYVRKRPALYKTGFNWGIHVLAGAVPALLIRMPGAPLALANLPILTVATVVSAIAYYAIETGLVAMAVTMQIGGQVRDTWRAQFRWLAEHYLALCVMGLLFAISYRALGPSSLAIFAPPVFILRYAQKQYVQQTESGVRELRRVNAALANANQEILTANTAIQRLNDELFLVLAKIIHVRDPYSRGHAGRVADYATAMAHELKLPAEGVKELRQAALLHDIGKVGISDLILRKTTELTPEEYAEVKAHASLGAELLETNQSLRHLAPLARSHHERWDGAGYPDGLSGEAIPFGARILAVCDAVDAMASVRPYHAGLSLAEIAAELRRCAGTQFDPALVDVFVRIVAREGEQLLGDPGRERDSNSVQKANGRQYPGRVQDTGLLAPVSVA